VLFDLGGTLVEADAVHPGEIFRRILAYMGISKSLDETKNAVLNADKEAKDSNLVSLFGKIQCEEYWRKWDSLVLKHLGLEENEELAKTVHSRWFDFLGFTLYPDSEEVQRELRLRGLKLGLVSNGYEEEIHLILEKVNLEKATFDIIVGVDTVQCMKPHPDVFKYALKKLKVKPEETVFVGDDVERDYRGATNACMHALLIDRKEKQKQSGLKTIKNLKEILSQID
jgi:HAD superfamily hydrolase (TIGR01549 family)